MPKIAKMEKNFLLFDRHWILNYYDERKAAGSFFFKVCPPQKPDRPFLIADQPWESMTLGWGTMLRDQGVYRLWYEAWDKTYTTDSQARLCYAESADGIRWKKPVLKLFEFAGNKNNNIVFDGTLTRGIGFHGSCVFIDPVAPAQARYRMIYFGYPENCAVRTMGVAYSADGIAWKWGIPEARAWCRSPYTGFGSDTQSVVYYDPDRRNYVGYFRNWVGNYGRAIDRAETGDFGKWPYPETILKVDESDPFGIDFYNSAASRYVSGGEVAHLMFISVFNMSTDKLNVQLATSRDGIFYKRLDRRPFLDNGESFDRGCVYMCPGIHEIGDKSAMVYLGVKHKHGEAKPDRIAYDGGFGFLQFPRDRFQGLSTDGVFEFNLAAFENQGQDFKITLNADAGSRGGIRAGLMPAKGAMKYLKGFSPEDCRPVNGDGAELPLNWKGGLRSKQELGEKVELRLFLKKSVLYSVRIRS